MLQKFETLVRLLTWNRDPLPSAELPGCDCPGLAVAPEVAPAEEVPLACPGMFPAGDWVGEPG